MAVEFDPVKRRATLEAMAWLEWLNRFAEAEGLGDGEDTHDG